MESISLKGFNLEVLLLMTDMTLTIGSIDWDSGIFQTQVKTNEDQVEGFQVSSRENEGTNKM